MRGAAASRLLVGALAVSWVTACQDAPAQKPAPPEGPARPPAPTPEPFDPTALARSTFGLVKNPEAGIPPQCYTKTGGESNPCWTCHTESTYPNVLADWELQAEYAFSDEGLTNHWTNLFVDRSKAIDAITDERALAWVRQDNYTPLREALRRHKKYPGYRPDLDFALGFDREGFAKDGSGWRAFRYKPFPGVFWPTNGSTDDVLIRLPRAFREVGGKPSRAVYRANLAILEASFASDPEIAAKSLRWPTEPLDEVALDHDLDGDDQKTAGVTELVGLPDRYLGDAKRHPVRRAIYPEGTEFLHSVRYLDPDAPGLIARRMKELRYSKKARELDTWGILRAYEHEQNEKDEGRLPSFAGHPLAGLRNAHGWVLQAFIEDAEGRLRVQTHEEHLACMGCHSNLGVTLDQTFSFPRKVPGRDGWGYQSLDGIPDVPQLGHRDPEFLTYLRRVGAGDEFRANDEVIERFIERGRVREAEVRRAAPGGDRTLAHLVAPSRERALLLDKATMALVFEQRFEKGRDVTIRPPKNVHDKIETDSTGLREKKKLYTDGQLRLDWSSFLRKHQRLSRR